MIGSVVAVVVGYQAFGISAVVLFRERLVIREPRWPVMWL